MWTVYRLHDQEGRPAHLPRSGDLVEDLTPLLGELGYLGVFDARGACSPASASAKARVIRPSP